MVSNCEHPDKSRSFVTLLIWRIQAGVKTSLKRKDISYDHREENVPAYQSVKGFKTIFTQFVQSFWVRKDIHSLKTFTSVASFTTSRSDCTIIREHVKNPRASQTLQASLSLLNVTVHDNTIRKISKKGGRMA